MGDYMSQRKTIWGWYWFDWACQPFFTLLLTFIFAPFFAQVATEYYASGGLSEQSADARAQTLWSTGITIAGLIIAFSAPVLGAIADSAGRRMPWISFFTAAAILGAAATWFMNPAGSNLVTMLMAFVICYIGAELAFIFASAQLPDLGDDDSVGGISGSGLAFGYVGGVLSLVIVLLLFVGQENGKTIFLNLDPLFGFDPAEKEGTRFAGPFAALWCLVFSIPYFLWVREGHLPNRRPSISGAMTTLWQAIKGVLNRPSQGKFLISSMFYRDALNGLYTFGGIYAGLVLDWSIVQIGTFGIVAAISAGLFSWLGGKLDNRVGPKPVIYLTIFILMSVCVVIIGMSKTHFFGVELAAGSTLPDNLFMLCGCLIGGMGGMLQSASRSLMVRHAIPGKETIEFGLYGLSGRATAFLAPLLITIATTITDSARLGVSPIVILFVVGLVFLIGVNAKGDAR